MSASSTSRRSRERHPAYGRDARLRTQWQFDLMRASKDSQAGKYCVLVAVKTPPDQQCRAAFLISRRYSRLAVKRNRARRLFREAFRQLYPVINPCWLLFLPRRHMQDANLDAVVKEVFHLAGRLGLYSADANFNPSDSHVSTSSDS